MGTRVLGPDDAMGAAVEATIDLRAIAHNVGVGGTVRGRRDGRGKGRRVRPRRRPRGPDRPSRRRGRSGGGHDRRGAGPSPGRYHRSRGRLAAHLAERLRRRDPNRRRGRGVLAAAAGGGRCRRQGRGAPCRGRREGGHRPRPRRGRAGRVAGDRGPARPLHSGPVRHSQNGDVPPRPGR